MAYTSQPLSAQDESFPFHGTLRYPAPRTPPASRVPLGFWLLFWTLASMAMGFLCWAALRSIEHVPEKALRMADNASTLGLVRLVPMLPAEPKENVIALKEPAPDANPPPPPPQLEPARIEPALTEPIALELPKEGPPRIELPVVEPPPLPAPAPVEPTKPVVNLEPLEKVPAEKDD